MGPSLLKPLSRSVGPARLATCTERVVPRGGGGGGGGGVPPLRCLSQFLSYKKERDQLLMIL